MTDRAPVYLAEPLLSALGRSAAQLPRYLGVLAVLVVLNALTGFEAWGKVVIIGLPFAVGGAVRRRVLVLGSKRITAEDWGWYKYRPASTATIATSEEVLAVGYTHRRRHEVLSVTLRDGRRLEYAFAVRRGRRAAVEATIDAWFRMVSLPRAMRD